MPTSLNGQKVLTIRAKPLYRHEVVSSKNWTLRIVSQDDSISFTTPVNYYFSLI